MQTYTNPHNNILNLGPYVKYFHYLKDSDGELLAIVRLGKNKHDFHIDFNLDYISYNNQYNDKFKQELDELTKDLVITSENNVITASQLYNIIAQWHNTIRCNKECYLESLEKGLASVGMEYYYNDTYFTRYGKA